ncbi:MAG: O-antigen ligase family protein [Clostridia bacterium]|nr:O-antigen ligase family protein [Clostridia bacterium]
MKSGFGKWLSGFLEGSAILRGLDKLGSLLYKKLGQGAYSFAFGSYDTMCETFEDSAVGSKQKKKRGAVSRFLASNMEESVYVTAIGSMMRYLSRLSMRVIGVFLMSSGFYSLLAQLILYLLAPSDQTLLYGAISVAIILLSIPFLFSKRALCSVVYDSAVFGRIARDFCGFRERSFQVEGKPTGRKNAAFILGLPFGILSCFVNPALMLILMIGLIFAYIVLLNPECGYLLILFILPFLVVLPHPSILLALLTVYTFGCFVIKVILGKRSCKFELLDALVICFMAVMLLGGLISYGGMQSIKAASIYVVLMLGYFLTVGLVNTKEMLKKSATVLCVSLLLVSAYGLYQNFTGNISAEWIDTEMFESIGGRVVSTFENPNMLGLYLILLLPLLAAEMIGEKNWWKKPRYILSFAAGAACLIYTWARGAWLGFLFAAVVFLLMWNKRTMGLLLAGVLALPMLIPYLPASIVSRFSSIGDLTDTSTNYRVYIWRGSTKMAADYALTGIGIGEEAFNRIYPYYSFAGIEKAPHAHNLFLQLFIEVGIFGFIIFLALLICLFQCGFSLAKHGADKEVRLIGCGALCGVLAALVQGMTDYVWYNYRVFFVFWLVIGLVAAARRIDYAARQKHMYTSSACSVDLTLGEN